MRLSTHLTVLAILFTWACSENDDSKSLYPVPDTECPQLGKTECSPAAGGGWQVLTCIITDGLLFWKVARPCEFGCADGYCQTPEGDALVPEIVEELDSHGDGRGPDADGPDGFGGDAADVDGPDICVSSCDGKLCGGDGCGGSCGDCPKDHLCVEDGTSCCMPQCQGKLCGDDECGGSCGACPEDQECTAYNQCAPKCVPKCEDKDCGPDTCGGECGECPPGTGCGPDAKCSLCVPQCEGKECGDDGCDGSCGACPFGLDCKNNTCSEPCVPVCVDKDCGEDGCKGSCGNCMPGETCVDFKCKIICEASCAGKECGPDGCGGSCGKCPAWATCSPQSLCLSDCVAPDCEGKECGSDGCGGSCGLCPEGKGCNPDGQCVQNGDPCGGIDASGWCDGDVFISCVDDALHSMDCKTVGKNVVCEWLPALASFGCSEKGECLPDCDLKECGTDGCGGSCGSCLPGQNCDAGICVGLGPCGDVVFEGCCSGDTVLWCDNGVLWFMDCTALIDPEKQVCGWNEELEFYDCVDEKKSGPDEFPYYCEGPCIPDCSNKQCGDDGCGGDCGGCPVGTECANNVCKGEQGDCGGYAEDPVCQGHSVVWCEEGQVFFQDCQALGPFFKCGWVGDLFVYGCYEEECIPDCENKQCGDDGCGYVCGYCPVTMMCNDKAQCVYGQGFCGEIDYVGKCDGNLVKWCQNGVLQEFDCGNLGPTWQCGWYEDGGYYWCLDTK